MTTTLSPAFRQTGGVLGPVGMVRSLGTSTWFTLTPCLVKAWSAWLLVELTCAGDDEELENVSGSDVSLERSGLERAGSFCFQSWQLETFSDGGGAVKTLLPAK